MKLPVIYTLILLAFSIASCRDTGSHENIVIDTSMGEIHARIYTGKAPVTSANFLRYIDSGLFDSACFYRVVRMDNQPRDPVKIEVIQGGLYENEGKGLPPIAHETTVMTGLKHRNGTLSMARNEPGSATSEFFICIGDQPELDFGGRRNPDGQGFAAFGEVTGGMEVVRKIQSIGSSGQYLEKPVVILGIHRSGK